MSTMVSRLMARSAAVARRLMAATMTLLFVAVFALAGLALPAIASAQAVTFTIPSQSFVIGTGTIQGTFVYDATTDTLIDADISVSSGTANGGSALTAQTYTEADFLSLTPDNILVFKKASNRGLRFYVNSNSFTAGSGPITDVTFLEGTCTSADCSSFFGRLLFTGTVNRPAPAPTVSLVSPASGPTVGGTNVAISGANFTGVTAVTFGATAATSFAFNSDASITATAPAGTGTVDIRVTTAGGTSATSAADQFTYVAPAVVTSVSPAEGLANSVTAPANVTISGTGFSASGNTVTFAGSAGTVVSESVTSITVTPPARATAELVNVVVTTADSRTATAANAYRYLLPPTVTVTWSPNVVAATQSTLFSVTVTNPNAVALQGVRVASNGANTPFFLTQFVTSCGSGNYNASSAFSLTGFNLAAGASCTASSNQQGSPGAYQFVTNAPTSTGTATTAVTLTGVPATSNTITVYGAPFISSVSPSAGPQAGGQTVTLTGTNFAAATAVTFDGLPATSLTVVSPTSITAVTPARVGSGSVNVAVTGPGGTGTRSSGYTYAALPVAPTVSAPTNNVTTSLRPTYEGFSPSGSTITVYVDGVSIGTTFSFGGGGNWSLAQPTNLSDGAHTVYATATTAAGGTSASSTTINFTADGTPPAAPATQTPANGSSTSDNTPTYTGAAEPNSTMTVIVDGSPLGTTTSDASGNWILTPSTPLADGPHTVRATATDVAGNTSPSSNTNTFTVDTTAPITPVILGPTNSARIATATPIYSGTAEGGTTITIIVDGSPIGTTTVSSGIWQLTQPTTLAQGIHTVLASATDAVGNVSPAAAVSFFVDTIAPAYPVLVSPAPGSTTGDSTPQLSGTTEPNALVDIYVAYTYVTQVTADGSGAWTYQVVTPLPDATLAVQLQARDTASNGSGISPAVFVTIDTSAPSAPVVSTPANGSVTQNAVSVVTGTAEPATTVTVYVDGPSAGTAVADGSGNWTFTTAALAAGSHTVRATATDSASNVSPASNTNSFTYSPLSLPGGALASGQVGVAYTASLTATGGSAPFSYAVTGGALPAGIALATDGTLSGTPTAAGTFNFTVTVADDDGLTADGGYTITVAAPAVPEADPETTTVVSTGGPQDIDLSGSVDNAVSIEIVTPPANGSVTVDGFVVTYTPEPGFFGAVTFTYKAIGYSDGGAPGAESAPATVTITIPDPVLALAGGALPDGQAAVSYSTTLSASGGTAPYSYAVTAGSLPAGLSLSSVGVLSGTPTASGTFNFTVEATDSSTGTGPFTTSASYSLVIAAPAIVLTPETLAAAQAGVAYSQAVTASGGNGPYSYAVTAGALPPGLNLSSGGLLSGTPTAGGSFGFTITATDSTTGGTFTGSQGYSLSVGAAAIALSPTNLPDGTAALVYSTTLSASGGTAPYSYAVTAGALPAGLALSSGGVLSGTPTASGTFSFTVEATDSSTGTGPFTTSASYSLVIAAPAIALTPGTLTAAQAGVAYSQAVTASGGNGPYSYAVTAGALPPGLNLSSGGLLSGTPTAGGSFGFTITATDSTTGGTFTGSQAYTLSVGAAAIAVGPATLPNGSSATAYSQTITASGGTGPYSYALTAGALPTGVTVSAGGLLSGTPTAGGTFNFTITATDSSSGTGPFSGSRAYSLTIGAPTIVLNPASLPAATVAVSGYSQAITASGGVGTYSYALTAGALPAGMSLSTGGVLSGTPTAGGSFNFTVTATDQTTGAGPYTGSRAYTLTVNAAAIVVTPTSLPNASRGFAYSQAFSASGGTGSYTFTLQSGALPAGLTLSPTGVLSGVPTVTGGFPIVVRATDQSTGAGPYSGTVSLTLTVNAAAITVTPANLPNVMAGVGYSQQLSASGGSGTYSYAVTAGALPAGITLSATGRIAGTANTPGSYSFTATATDAFGNAGSVPLVLNVLARPDPSADPDVRGLDAAQAEATRRLTSTQIDNFSRRLEQLHSGAGSEPMNMGLTLNSGVAQLGQEADQRTRFGGGRMFGQEQADPDRAELDARLWSAADGLGQNGGQNAGVSVGGLNAGQSGGAPSAGGVRFWTGGAITLGERDGTNGQSSFSVRSTGISMGADLALSPNFDLGVGGGFGEESADVGSGDSGVDSSQFVGVVYASFRPQGGVYLDAMLGYGQLEFDLQRRVAADGSLVTGERDGTALFGSIGLGYDRPVSIGRMTAYGRVESLNAELDAYAETGSALWALSYAERDVESLQGVLGARYLWTHEGRDSAWTPSFRFEYRHEFADGGVQSLQYADWLAGPTYQIQSTGWDRSEINLGLGLNVVTRDGWSLASELGARLATNQTAGTLKLTLSRKF